MDAVIVYLQTILVFLRKHPSVPDRFEGARLRTEIVLRSLRECRECPSVHSADIESDQPVSVPCVEVVHLLALAWFEQTGDACMPLVSALSLHHLESARIPALPV